MASGSLALADARSIFEGNRACADSYSQCLKSMDFTLASTPAEGSAKLQSNKATMKACDETARACYEAVKAPHEFIAD
jgi:hypothetical protein